MSTTPPLVPSKPALSPTDEQSAIIAAIADGLNVKSDCGPGTGKTTTCKMIAETFRNKNIMQLTYNRALRDDVHEKTKELDNYNVYTYHSCATQWYASAPDDEKLAAIVNADVPIRISNKKSIDLIICDEAQDITSYVYAFIRKLYADLMAHYERTTPIQLMFIGDANQAVYNFRLADSRFLSLAPKLFPEEQYGKFVDLPLTLSHRLTVQMAKFVNTCVHTKRANPIRAKKDGPNVHYYQINVFAASHYALGIIEDALKSGWTNEDILILVPSVKVNAKSGSTKTPAKILENKLVDRGHLVYFPTSDDARSDQTVTANKITFSTFHQSKGREKPIVIVMPIDRNYDQYFSKESITERGGILAAWDCPPPPYVAMTRASHALHIIQEATAAPSRYILTNKFKADFVTKVGSCKIVAGNAHDIALHPMKSSPTELLKYVPTSVVVELRKIKDRIFVCDREPYTEADIQTRIETNIGDDDGDSDNDADDANGGATSIAEDVSAINGIGIPIKWEFDKTGKSKVKNLVDRHKKQFEQYRRDPETEMGEWLQIANIYISHKDGIISNLAQITNYDWLSGRAVRVCKKVLDEAILGSCDEEIADLDFERLISCREDTLEGAIVNNFIIKTCNKYIGLEYNAFIDLVSESAVWELKCVGELSIDHFAQLMLYAWLWMRVVLPIKIAVEKVGGDRGSVRMCDIPDTVETDRVFSLLNIRTGERWSINTEHTEYMSALDDAFAILLRNKYARPVNNPDDVTFVQNMLDFATSVTGTLCSDSQQPQTGGGGKQPLRQPSSEHKYVMVLDTETTGFVDPVKVVQLGYLLYEDDGKHVGSPIKKVSSYVNRLVRIQPGAIKVHGITQQMLYDKGISWAAVLEELDADLARCHTLVCHNVAFDTKVVLSDSATTKFGAKISQHFNQMHQFCTMVRYAPIVNKDNGKSKAKCKLEDAYKHVFGTDFDGAHDALSDVLATYQVHTELQKRNGERLAVAATTTVIATDRDGYADESKGENVAPIIETTTRRMDSSWYSRIWGVRVMGYYSKLRRCSDAADDDRSPN